MEYKLYTTVDITATGQYRTELGKELDRWKEQNFQTVLQTIGLRANISYYNKPMLIEVRGSFVGFNTEEIIHVWRFDFYTEHDFLFDQDDNPVGYLVDAFDTIPYISGLDESMEQNYDVFVTQGPARNIVFQQK
jgi:hypothetical protein